MLGKQGNCFWVDSDEHGAVLQTIIDYPQCTSSGACLVTVDAHFPDQLMSEFPWCFSGRTFYDIGQYHSLLYFSLFQGPFPWNLSASVALAALPRRGRIRLVEDGLG